MNLKAPCEHGRYEGHARKVELDEADWVAWGKDEDSGLEVPMKGCPGGTLLPEDTLVIVPEVLDGRRFWPVWAVAAVGDTTNPLDALAAAQRGDG